MTTSDSVRDALLEFAGKQPLWAQDVLRRIVTRGKPLPADLDDAVAMCKAAYGLLAADEAPPPVPLAPTHFSASSLGGGSAVSLLVLHDLENVNALQSGQSLAFNPTGITIIYGTNGAGKSGYARVLKRLCRARGGTTAILPNVFSTASGTPRASITFEVDGTTNTWTGDLDGNGPSSPDALAEVAVYDGAAGAHTVERAQAVKLLPSGLDVLPTLKDVYDHVSGVLKKEGASDEAAVLPSFQPGTSSESFIRNLSINTTKAELDLACAWTDDDETARLQAAASVAELRARDPKRSARNMRRNAERLESLVAALDKATTRLGEGIEARVFQRIRELKSAQVAVELQRGDLLPADVLPGTGGDTWKLLWEAARTFSEANAYIGHGFPHVSAGTRCVLCQQVLSDEAVTKMQTFEAYVAAVLSKNLKAAEAAITQGREYVAQAIEPGLSSGALIDVLEDTEDVDFQAVKRFVLAATERRDALLACLDHGALRAEVPALPGVPTTALKKSAAFAWDQANRLDESNSADAVNRAVAAMHELDDRKALSGARPHLEADLARQRRANRRKVAIGSCQTASTSALLGSLTKIHVTDTLAAAFNDELAVLGGEHLAVEVVKSGTSKATAYTGLALKNALHGKAVLPSVFSEGEQRAVSLAWFFAELALPATRSAIVFDDPVTSLDHDWRRKVANRLAHEATRRQVIVFTHDAVFLHMLNEASVKACIAPVNLQVQRSSGQPGYCSVDVPWEKMSVKQRVATLKQQHVTMTMTKRIGTDEEYAQAVVAFLDRLRKTWERAIEECLFNGVIERFGYGVKTLSLSEVDVLKGDHAAIHAGMAACSAWVHDPAQGLSDPPPSPTEIKGMVNDLVAWVNILRERRGSRSLPKLTAL
jgi:ABC-type lipoprotein export system ATPase subunit